jgi:hypothetical protein
MGGTRHDATTSHAGVSDLAWQHLSVVHSKPPCVVRFAAITAPAG